MKELQLNIFGARLRSARLIAGLSLQELSDKMDNNVTKQALSKYEKGLMKPSSSVLMMLSKALGFKPDYFLRDSIVQFKEVEFRKKSNLSKKDEMSVLEVARRFYERYSEIESILGIESHFNNPLAGILISSYDDVEMAALRLRDEWDLGLQPVSNILEMLESKGIKILLLEGQDNLDGISILVDNNEPVVVINSCGKSIERIRFTIIHELAHSLLKFSKSILSDKKLMEKMCHYFASCFLLPTKILLKMIGNRKRTYIRIEELINIKKYVGISIRAIVYRLKQIRIITENYYKRWSVWLTKTYGAKEEPGRYIGVEESNRFMQLINHAISEGLISLSKASSLTGMPINQIKSVKEFV